MWPPTRRQAAVAVRGEGSASVRSDFWFSACWHGIPSALTALYLTCFCLLAPSAVIQIIGRVNADPDYLPRATDFGLNVSGFLEHYCPPNCPTAFFPMAAVCCDLDADKRSGKFCVWLTLSESGMQNRRLILPMSSHIYVVKSLQKGF